MTTLLYSGVGKQRDNPAELPASRSAAFVRSEGYLADDGLVDAVNVALLLGQPLLLTGEPGTGKTELARSLAAELGLGDPLRFDTKSTSTARDLFYSFDAVRRFHAANTNEGSQRTADYLTFNALGRAILHSQEREKVADCLPEGYQHPGACRSVVLIDEIDKAPRDFPNDILAELESLHFRIPELGNQEIVADPNHTPVLIMTSNSEKHLPDAFLRRCIYYDIPFPDQARLEKILWSRFGTAGEDLQGLLGTALDLFFRLRNDSRGLRKKPATAELISWIRVLRSRGGDSENPLQEKPELARETIGALIKTREDQRRAREIVEQWMAHQSDAPKTSETKSDAESGLTTPSLSLKKLTKSKLVFTAHNDGEGDLEFSVSVSVADANWEELEKLNCSVKPQEFSVDLSAHDGKEVKIRFEPSDASGKLVIDKVGISGA
jgi:MoxR-like ATPase